MPKSDDRPGLLSKVAKFVRNPTVDWSDLDKQPPEGDTGYSKEALKEMIERKRKNDFVRKREFDQLRKLRRGGPVVNADQVARSSFLDSDLSSHPAERAETLKKIDEIEAQMSQQWWKNKQEAQSASQAPAAPAAQETLPPAELPVHDADPSGPISSPLHEAQQYPPTEVSPLLSAQTPAPPVEPGFAPTQLAHAPTALAPMGAASEPPQYQPTVLAPHSGMGALGSGLGGLGGSRHFAPEPEDSLSDPDLEEAAIRFANGDPRGAEEVLLSALQTKAGSPELVQAWIATLFDLYRASGQQARFEAVAPELALRFGCPMPTWSAAAAPVPAAAPSGQPLWTSPQEITRQSVADLLASVAHRPAPWLIDWHALNAIAPDAVDLLGQLFADWAAAPVDLVFRGWESLDRALKTVTPSGNKSVAPLRWKTRMDALRIMGLQDEFELVALEYCVTYEVAPPSWQDPRGQCRLETGSGAVNVLSRTPQDDVPSWSSQAATVPMGLDAPTLTLELSGELLGEVDQLLNQLGAGAEGASHLVVSCAQLVRVDFTAAGSILNWVAQKQSQGCQVQLRDVNRIVAVFFSVIGITEHARVLTPHA